ncbi:MAG: MATE family efflux transporter [Ruminococcaceae bacterium]|nr:MATE family efflux transporter [Oscillospiraceae bacterium]
MVNDLTKGKTSKVILYFSLPLFISVIFQQMYSIADSVIAGRFAGEAALASVGASYPITNIFNAIAVGCNIGCGVVISQLFGAGKYRKVKTAVYTSLISSLVISVVLTVLGILLTPKLMELINTPEDIFSDSALYLKIYIAGFTFLFLYNIANGVFASLGNSKIPLYFLIFSSVTNVILDYIFVAYLNMGVSGVAWATFIAQGIAGVMSVLTLLYHLKSLKTDEKAEIFSFEMLKSISKISIPSVLQQSFVSVGNVFIQGEINSYGSAVIAGYSAAIKLNTFAVNSLVTFGNSVSSFTAQNVGAMQYKRIKEGFKSGAVLSIITAIIFSVVYVAFSETLIGVFMEGDKSVLALTTGKQFLIIVEPFLCFIGFKVVCDGVLRGTGNMKYFMFATFADLVLRVILAFIFSHFFGAVGIWLSWPIGWGLAVVLSFAFYKKVVKVLEIRN